LSLSVNEKYFPHLAFRDKVAKRDAATGKASEFINSACSMNQKDTHAFIKRPNGQAKNKLGTNLLATTNSLKMPKLTIKMDKKLLYGEPVPK